MKIGEELVVMKTWYDKDKDVAEFIRIKIVEEKTDVPGDYGGKNFKGYKAVALDNPDHFLYNSWYVFDEAAMNPYGIWFDGNKFYEEITNLLLVLPVNRGAPRVIKEHSDLYDWCPKHGRIWRKDTQIFYNRYMNGEPICYECREALKENCSGYTDWKGWF